TPLQPAQPGRRKILMQGAFASKSDPLATGLAEYLALATHAPANPFSTTFAPPWMVIKGPTTSLAVWTLIAPDGRCRDEWTCRVGAALTLKCRRATSSWPTRHLPGFGRHTLRY